MARFRVVYLRLKIILSGNWPNLSQNLIRMPFTCQQSLQLQQFGERLARSFPNATMLHATHTSLRSRRASRDDATLRRGLELGEARQPKSCLKASHSPLVGCLARDPLRNGYPHNYLDTSRLCNQACFPKSCNSMSQKLTPRDLEIRKC